MDFRSEKLLLVDIGGTNFRSAIRYLGSDKILETKKLNGIKLVDQQDTESEGNQKPNT